MLRRGAEARVLSRTGTIAFDGSAQAGDALARLDLLHRDIQQYGTITHTLRMACDLSGTIRAVSKGAAAP